MSEPTWDDIRERLGPDEFYYLAWFRPPRPGLFDPLLADLDNRHLVWWAWAESRSTRRQIFEELIGRDITQAATDAAYEGWNARDQRTRTEALKILIREVDPEGYANWEKHDFDWWVPRWAT